MHDVYREGRTIYISGPIDSYMKDARRQLRELAVTDPNKKIVLVISSPGGSVFGGFALMDEMELLKRQTSVQFEAVVEGWAMSMGSIILQAAHHRIAGPHSQLMVHGITSGIGGDEEDMLTELNYTKALNARVAAIYGSRTAPLGGKTTAQWRTVLRRNLPRFYSAEEALAERLIDEVI